MQGGIDYHSETKVSLTIHYLQCKLGQIIYTVGQIINNNSRVMHKKLQWRVGQITIQIQNFHSLYNIICNASWDRISIRRERSSLIIVALCIKICNARWDILFIRWDYSPFRNKFSLTIQHNLQCKVGQIIHKVGQISTSNTYTVQQNMQCKWGQIICKLGQIIINNNRLMH